MHPLSPLFGVVILAAVLTANYFRAAWNLGILQAFGRRRDLGWRTLVAGSLAALLPMVGALLALSLVPGTDGPDTDWLSIGPGTLAAEMSACGLSLNAVSDWLVRWGRPGQPPTA